MLDEENQPNLLIKRMHEDAHIPTYATKGSAGFDLYAVEPKCIEPGFWEAIETGLAVSIPNGHVGLLFTRSGNAVKHGIGLINSVGVIDSDFTGEVKVPLFNQHKTSPFHVEKGDRIGQMVIVPFAKVLFEEVEELPNTNRGEGGFGSTGTK